MEWKPTAGSHLIPTPREVLDAILDYAGIFLRLPVDWLAAFGIVKLGEADDNKALSDTAEDADDSWDGLY